MSHPNDFLITTAPSAGDGVEGSLRKINQLLARAPHELVPIAVAVKQVTIAGAAGTLEGLGNFTFNAKTRFVQVAIETADVRTDASGAVPTASAGQPVASGDTVLLSIAEAKTGKWIRSSSTSATAQVTQYGGGG